jgi:predicted phage-related endonuclease
MSKTYEFVRAEQRSPQWHALRATGLGASDMAAVANVSP